MGQIEYYLIASMIMSVLWGLLVIFFGAFIRFRVAEPFARYVKDVRDFVRLDGTINRSGQNICPVRTNSSDTLNLGEWSDFMGSLIIATGVLIILLSTVGFIAGVKQSNLLLLLMVIFILAAASLQFFLLSVTVHEKMQFHEDAKYQLITLLESEFEIDNEDNVFAATMNAIMLTGECCGILGPGDFHNMTFTDEDQNDTVYVFKVAPACCKRALFNMAGQEVFSVLKKCAIVGKDDQDNINTKGCYSTVFEHVRDNYAPLIVIAVVLLSIWEMLQVILAVMLILRPRSGEEADEEKSSVLLEKPSKEKEAKPKKFIPYWTVSSFQTGDVNRIRSTEIW